MFFKELYNKSYYILKLNMYKYFQLLHTSFGTLTFWSNTLCRVCSLEFALKLNTLNHLDFCESVKIKKGCEILKVQLHESSKLIMVQIFPNQSYKTIINLDRMSPEENLSDYFDLFNFKFLQYNLDQHLTTT